MNMRRVTRRRVLGSVGAASIGPVLQARVRADAGPALQAGTRTPELSPAFTLDVALRATHSTSAASVPHVVSAMSGQVRGAQWQGDIASGLLEYTGDPGTPSGLRGHLVLQERSGELIELRVRAVRSEVEGDKPQMTMHCEMVRTAPGSAACPAVLVGRLELRELAAGRLRSAVFEVS